MTNEERSELKRLYWLMTEYFEKVDIFKEKSDLERLALEISTRGMQTIGAILGEVEEHKVAITKKFYDEDANIYDCFEDAYQQGKTDGAKDFSEWLATKRGFSKEWVEWHIDHWQKEVANE